MKELIEPELLRTLASDTQVGKWKVHEEYKDSGVEWMDKVPAHWEVRRLKATILECQNGIWGDEPTHDEKDIICVRVADFNRQNHQINSHNLTIRSISLTQRQSRILQQGDLLIEKSGGGELQPVGVVIFCNLETPAVCSNFIARIKVAKNNYARFLCYLHAAIYEARINTLFIKQNTGIQNLDANAYFNQKVALPSLFEQQVITAFLNRETVKLNSLIAHKERMITLLQERRTAIINQAVTKGLNLDMPMKDSGVDWLGEIPAHWEVRKIKYIAKFFGGGTPSKGNIGYWSGNIPWVSPKDMKSEIILDTEDHISVEALENSTTNLISAGAVLIVVRSGILKHTIPIAINDVPVTINQDIKAILPNNLLLSKYLASLIHSHQKIFLMEWRKSGATVESIEYDLLINTLIPIPPVEEQKEIITSIQQRTVPIDKLISVIQEGIKKLQEYSAALISAAVTGKIDVRGEVADVQGEEAAI